ncbi:MAG: hypothetical protein Q8M15_01235 [Bacteroidota bacterium]|nr:hypothetical protein [Bacteroidota bacterium]
MKNNFLLLILVITCPVLAQESGNPQKKQRGSEIYYGVGVDNNKYTDVNRFLRDYNFPANFNSYDINFAFGLSITMAKTKFEMYANFSSQSDQADSKKFKLNNQSLQYLYHIKFINKDRDHASLYSGIGATICNIQIDSIYKPIRFGTFNSINADKVFFDIPIGMQLTHYFPNKKATKPYAFKYMIGLKAAYHVTIYQDDWDIGLNARNSLNYRFKQPDYFELILIFGFYR